MNNPDQSTDRIPRWTEWSISVLNGMVGDYLQERQNGLAINMAYYQHNRPLLITADNLRQTFSNPTPKLCLLIHGLGCNEGVWAFADKIHHDPTCSYGTLLQQDLGYTPFYLRYNTGLSVAENGKQLSRLLDELLTCYPVSVDEISLIGHSMGGLVLRSACHYAIHHQYDWVKQVRRAFYLGTPHDGADLEKVGHVTTAVLAEVPNPITQLIGRILNLRSRGVKDLRFGNLVDEDWDDDFPDKSSSHRPKAVPWLAHAHHYLIVGTVTGDPRHPASRLLGDTLVRVPPARRASRNDSENANQPAVNITVFPGVHHLGLAHDNGVYQQIKQWCEID
ncbi:MAG: alpha/beta hydrolase [Candidatus Competibacteraceae bacterium]|nr:alpha/beta hydrolase [Candidatus Competibacteraceae bacterium]